MSWLGRIFRSRHVEYLEDELRRSRERESALLDRLLIANGRSPVSEPVKGQPPPLEEIFRQSPPSLQRARTQAVKRALEREREESA